MKITLRNKWFYASMLVVGMSALTACHTNTQGPESMQPMQPMTMKEVMAKCHQDCNTKTRNRCYNDCVKYHKSMMRKDGMDGSMDQSQNMSGQPQNARRGSSY